jgi:hypothetical protein
VSENKRERETERVNQTNSKKIIQARKRIVCENEKKSE